MPATRIVIPAQEIVVEPASATGAAGVWQRVLGEFRASAIPDSLTVANIQILVGEDLLQELTERAIAELGGHAQQYVTREVQRITQRYENVAAGGAWVCYGTTVGGEPGKVPVIKPFVPRTFQKGVGQPAKAIKYETPSKAPGTPILPWIPKQYIKLIEARWGVSIPRDVPLWTAIQNDPAIPIAITEGVKKALVLVAMGIPAVAVRGVTMWRVRGTDELCPDLEALAQRGRKVFLFFDQDEKPKTQKAVFGQAVKLGKALQSQGCDFRPVTWRPELGKGIDDVLVNLPANQRGSWLDELLQGTQTLQQLQRCQTVSDALSRLENLQKLTYPVERHSTGQYLPQLPPLRVGAIHAVSAPMGVGKTVRVGTDWVAPWKKGRGNFVVVLSPLNSLGQQTAKNWDLPHIHDFADSEGGQKGLEATMRGKGGLVLCPDSLHRLPSWVWNQQILLVLDEANQALDHLTRGNTLGNRWGAINHRFAQLATVAKVIVAAEANLPERTLTLLKELSQKATARVFTHGGRQTTPWRVTLYTGHSHHTSGYFAQLLARLAAGEKLLFVSSSKFAGHRLEGMVQQLLPHLKVTRIDSDTNEGTLFTDFFEHPDQWLSDNQPNLLICSPSVKSGVSIQGGIDPQQAYFQSVWGYFPSGTTDLHHQLLGRFRPAVPRYIYCPVSVYSDSDETSLSAHLIRRELQKEALAITQALGLGHLVEIKDGETARIQGAIFDFYAQSLAVQATMRRASLDYLARLLDEDGHQLTYQALVPDAPTKDLMGKVRCDIEQAEAETLASINVEEWHTVQWAQQTLQSQARLSDRYRARKVLLQQDFPGIDFHDAKICRQAVVEDYSALIRGVKLHAHTEERELVKLQDAYKVRDILHNQALKSLHKLPKTTVCATLVNALRILELLGQTYGNQTPLVQEIKAIALHHRHLVQRYLRLNINAEQTGVHIVNKLLRRLCLEPQAIARPGTKERERLYQVVSSELREDLLRAYRTRLASSRPSFGLSDSKLNENHGRGISTEISYPGGETLNAVQQPNPPPPKE